MHHVLIIAAMLLACVLLGALLSRIGFPRVAAYVGVGVVFSRDVLGARIGFDVDAWSDLATAIALGVIAYIIGGSLEVSSLRRLGRTVALATIGEALGAVAAVFAAVSALAPAGGVGSGSDLALALAAVAATTDPAATVAVIHQYRARGPASEMLLGIAGLDDAVGVIVFAVIAALLAGDGLGGALGGAAVDIGAALALGGLGGVLLGRHGGRVRVQELALPLVLSGLFMVIGLADAVGASTILAAMAFGFTARASARVHADRLFGALERGEETVFLAFFAVAGTHFRAQVFVDNLQWIAVYVVARALGKYAGAWLGSRLGGAPVEQARWIGLGLVPQAGVAIGLALTLSHQPRLAGLGPTLVNIILGSAILYELVGPFLARLALGRLGELGARREVARR